MRDIVFHLADSSMEGGLRSFFRREKWNLVLGCCHFNIDPDSQQDIFRVGGSTDGGLWKHAHEHLATHFYSHERAVIILDEDFSGSPGANVLREEIAANMKKRGWDNDRFEVVVIQPMLEAWLWANNVNVAKAFGFDDFPSLQELLVERGVWQAGQPKPCASKLKDAKKIALQFGGKNRLGHSPFGKLFGQISSRACNTCQEPSFKQMHARLQSWFPLEGGER